MKMLLERLALLFRLVVTFYASLAAAKTAQDVTTSGYKVGERIPVSCLNRTMYGLATASMVEADEETVIPVNISLIRKDA